MKQFFAAAILGACMLAATGARSQMVITTYAGTPLTGGWLGDGGPAIAACLTQPTDVVFDTLGNLYIADFLNNVIRIVDTGGFIYTYAGTGAGAGVSGGGGYSGDGGSALSADMNGPYAIAMDKTGNLFIADGYNHVVRKVTPAGMISNFAGNHTAGYSGDNGPAVNAAMNNPVGLAIDDTGNVYIADDHNNVIRKVNTSGIITTFAGDSTAGHAGNGGPAAAALLSLPLGVAVDKSGNVYIADADNNVIRKVGVDGLISDYVGHDTVSGYSGDGGLATAAQLDYPVHLAFDDSDNLYIADAQNNVVRKVTPEGTISTVAGDGYGHGTNGALGNYGGDDGDPLAAEMYLPHSMAISRQRYLYIADRGNNIIRKVAPKDLTAVPNAARASSVQVYPNPVKGGWVTINIAAPGIANADVAIMDMLGHTVRHSSVPVGRPVSAQVPAAAGIYLLAVRAGTQCYVQRVVVQ